MSDNAADRPLTRRERRLLEMQQDEQSVHTVESSEEVEPDDSAQGFPDVDEGPAESAETEIEIDESLIVIPDTDEDGNPLSRREMRGLREEAIEVLRQEKLAEIEANRVDDEEDDEEAVSVIIEADIIVEETVVEEASVEDTIVVEAVEVDSPAEDFDESNTDTQAYSFEELREIADDAERVEHDAPESAKDGAVADDADFEDVVVDVEVGTFTDLLNEVGIETAEKEAAEGEETSELGIESLEVEYVEVESVEVEADDTYSFPDIKPLEEDRPVFDDPTTRTVGVSAPQGTGFDDMLQRAVADEDSNVHNGTSSLILPTIPGTGDLSGAIGSTGELFVTGSIELPKSFGETGGHSKLQESVQHSSDDDEEDALDMLNLTDMYETGEFDSQPVSAIRSVSSRSIENSGITTPDVQQESKKSLILISTGGGLILVLVGVGIWVAKSGLFG